MSFEPISGELVVESAVTLNETTRADVAVASYQGAVHLAWTGSDHHINTMWSPDGYNFTGEQTLEYQSTVTVGSPNTSTKPGQPSLASGSSGLLLAWPCRPSSPRGTFPCVMWFGHGAGGVTFVGQDKFHGTHTETPVAAWGDGAAVVWVAMGNKLMMAQSHGTAFGQPVEIGKGYRPLSVCTVNNELVVASIGTGIKSNLSVLWSQGGVFGQPIVCPSVSLAKVCGLGNELVVWWRRRRSSFIGFLRGGALVPVLKMNTPRRRLGSDIPSLYQHDGGLVVAWPGDDGRINVARLRRA